MKARIIYNILAFIFCVAEAAHASTNVAVFTNMVRVPCGIASPSESETRQAFRDCLDGLQKNLTNDSLKALIVEDNLNQPAIIRAAMTEALKNFPTAKTLYISIPWENPPPEFPATLNAQSAKDRRSISMTAITGNVAVKFVHAPQLSEAHEPPDYAARRVTEVTPAVRELVRSLQLTGPVVSNALFTFPRDPEEVNLRKAAENIAMVGHTESHAERWTSLIGNETRANEIVLAVISGNLGEHDWSSPVLPRPIPGFGIPPPPRQVTPSRPPANRFAGVSKMFEFQENPRMQTYRNISDVGLRILKNADEIETYRLWNSAERYSHRLTEAPKGAPIDDHVIKAKGPLLKPSVKETLQEIMFHEPQRPRFAGCGFDPGIAFRMTTAEGSINALVCFDCVEVRWTVRNPSDVILTQGSIHPDLATMSRLRQIGLIAFPDFKQLSRADE